KANTVHTGDGPTPPSAQFSPPARQDALPNTKAVPPCTDESPRLVVGFTNACRDRPGPLALVAGGLARRGRRHGAPRCPAPRRPTGRPAPRRRWPSATA